MKNLSLPDNQDDGILISYTRDITVFFYFLFEYIFHKLDQLFYFLHVLTKKNIQILLGIKFSATAKLIWARGRLSKYIKYTFIFFMTLSVYLTGSVFQNDLTIQPENTQTSYVSTLSGFFIGSVNLATKQGAAALLDSPVEHVVKDGETLQSIGKFYGISIETIKFANNLVSNSVTVGQNLHIPRVEGTLHTVKRGDTLASLAKKYSVSEQSIVDFNYIDKPYVLTEGQILTVPETKQPTGSDEALFVGRQVYDTSAYGIIDPAKSGAEGTGRFAWPFSGVITTNFSSIHPALDIAAPTGDIKATDKGVVIRAGWWEGGFGNAVQVDHRNGYVSTYAHMSVIKVSVGQDVEKGQALGIVGATGHATGPHVHFVIQLNKQYINPLALFAK